MAPPKRSFRSSAISPSQGVVTMIAGGLGGAACAAAGLGGAGLGASLPEGGGAAEPSGFCSSAIWIPGEDHYTYHLPGGGVKLGPGVVVKMDAMVLPDGNFRCTIPSLAV